MGSCWTEENSVILLKEMIKTRNSMFLQFREQLQFREPPVGYLFVSGFNKAAYIIAPAMVFSSVHKTHGNERGQALFDW